MILKQTNRRVTHLDLKFLDLKIMSIQPQSSFAPLTTKVQKSQLQDEDKTFTSKGRNKFADRSANKYSKLPNNYNKSREEDYTNDVTINQMHGSKGNSIVDASQEGECLNQSIIKYLNVDTSLLYNQIKDKEKEQRKEKQSLKSKCVDSIDRLLGKYHSQIEQIERENNLIHKEIKNIHISKLNDKTSKVKIVTNMKVFESVGQNRVMPFLDNLNNEGTFDLCRYRSQNKHAQDTHRSFLGRYPLFESKLETACNEKENQVSKRKKFGQKQVGHIEKEGNRLERGRNMIKKQGIGQFPALIHNKYENFYENLFRNKQNNSIYKSDPYPNFSPPNQQEVDRLNELKKKMLNNNFDKNFQAYLISRKLRVPEFLKNLR